MITLGRRFLNTSLNDVLFQSQFRFDNECHMSMPDNHKKVSVVVHGEEVSLNTKSVSLFLCIFDP